MGVFAGNNLPDEVIRGMLANLPPAARAEAEKSVVWSGTAPVAAAPNDTSVATPTGGIRLEDFGGIDPYALPEEVRRAVASGNGNWEQLFTGRARGGEIDARNPAGIDATQNDESRRLQQNTIQNLHRLAMGDPNSQAQQQLGTAFSQARGNTGSLAAARRDVGTGAAMRGSAFNQNQLQQQQAQQSQLLMLQERQAAQEALLGALSGQRGQDVGFQKANVDAKLGNRGNADFRTSTYAGMLGNAGANSIGAGVNKARSNLGLDAGWGELYKEGGQRAAEAVGTTISTLGSIFGDD